MKKFKPSNFGNFAKQKTSVVYTSEEPDIESDTVDDMNHIHKEFGEQKQKEIQGIKSQTNADYYLCVYFKNKEQKNEFIEKSGLSDFFDNSLTFINGEKMAKKLSIEIKDVNLKKKTTFAQGKRFSSDDFIIN